jgi:hypothetical protein
LVVSEPHQPVHRAAGGRSRVDSDERLFDPTVEAAFDRTTTKRRCSHRPISRGRGVEPPDSFDTEAALWHPTETPSDADGLTDRDG